MTETLPDLMTTKEVADYLRIKERRVYELLKAKAIPATRVTGKWLFPKSLIDLWLAQNLDGEPSAGSSPPPVIAGSNDPLLDWAVKESGCGLALLSSGSLDGLTKLGEGKALAAGLHIFDPEERDFNRPAVAAAFSSRPVVLVQWAWRQQGLVVAPGNPLGLSGLWDLGSDVRVMARQKEAGSQILLSHLCEEAGIDIDKLSFCSELARSEMDLGLAILEGKADCGLAVEAAARSLKLDFLPLFRERYDLLMLRRDFFCDPVQRLFAFCRTPAFVERAKSIGGYEIEELGLVHYNGP